MGDFEWEPCGSLGGAPQVETIQEYVMAIFAKFGDVKGASTDGGHKDWSLCQSISAPISRSIPAGARDQQRARGETTLGDMVIVRELDKASVKLAEACATGTFFAEVDIDLTSTIKGKSEPYLKYKLKNVIITSYSFHGTNSGDPIPSEEVTLGYTDIEWTYVVVNPQTGSVDGNVPAKYSLGQHKA